MAIWSRRELYDHLGHQLEVASYGAMESVTIECVTCGAVLVAGEDLELVSEVVQDPEDREELKLDES